MFYIDFVKNYKLLTNISGYKGQERLTPNIWEEKEVKEMNLVFLIKILINTKKFLMNLNRE